MNRLVCTSAAFGFLLAAAGGASSAEISVTQTTDPIALGAALGASGLTNVSVTTPVGDPRQFGTYTGWTQGPVLINNGVVLSTGLATDTGTPSTGADTPSTDFMNGSTPEIDAYAPGHVQNWMNSYDAAVLRVDFSLTSSSAVAFDFVFGSIEYPEFTSEFTDAFYVFLDGTVPADQIAFDAHGHAVQVGDSFAGSVITNDPDTTFNNPHGILPRLTTTSQTLAAGTHTLRFEVADTNDGILDSAVFLTGLRTAQGGSQPQTEFATPEPATLTLLGVGCAGLAAYGWRRRK